MEIMCIHSGTAGVCTECKAKTAHLQSVDRNTVRVLKM